MDQGQDNPKTAGTGSQSRLSPGPNNAVLRVDRVTKSYQSRCVLHAVGFVLAAGERVSLVGPSGCGKTTLLNCLGGIDRADRGTIHLGELALEKLNSDE